MSSIHQSLMDERWTGLHRASVIDWHGWMHLGPNCYDLRRLNVVSSQCFRSPLECLVPILMDLEEMKGVVIWIAEPNQRLAQSVLHNTYNHCIRCAVKSTSRKRWTRFIFQRLEHQFEIRFVLGQAYPPMFFWVQELMRFENVFVKPKL